MLRVHENKTRIKLFALQTRSCAYQIKYQRGSQSGINKHSADGKLRCASKNMPQSTLQHALLITRRRKACAYQAPAAWHWCRTANRHRVRSCVAQYLHARTRADNAHEQTAAESRHRRTPHALLTYRRIISTRCHLSAAHGA
ncbi:hypothetical protein AVEN_107804-1 [Araneus ventricosus]|uniref:Uncharacterized protein n=1 Tax=Araneus ventricosus TaxID=182803 RepID=A0A4Y2A180_ARAVE|nr:hypothetical protein AVEN_107804-1 [Araneus ventricosus]